MKLLALLLLGMPVYGMNTTKRSLEKPYLTLGEWILVEDLPDKNTSFKKLKIQRGCQLRRFASLPYLSLCMSYQGLSEIPEGMYDLENIKGIDLSHNRLQTIDGITRITSVQELWLSYNDLEKLPCLARLNLCKLCLVGNKLTLLPESVGSMSSLTLISLGYNNLTSLPPLQGLTRLEQLCANNNRLIQFPEGIEECSNLHSIGLHANFIEHIPPKISMLTNLRHLWLANNHLTALPPSLGTLSHLISLNIMDNPFGRGPSGAPASTSFMMYSVVGKSILKLVTNLYEQELIKMLPRITIREQAHFFEHHLPTLLEEAAISPTRCQTIRSALRLFYLLKKLTKKGCLYWGNALDNRHWILSYEENTHDYYLPKEVRALIMSYVHNELFRQSH